MSALHKMAATLLLVSLPLTSSWPGNLAMGAGNQHAPHRPRMHRGNMKRGHHRIPPRRMVRRSVSPPKTHRLPARRRAQRGTPLRTADRGTKARVGSRTKVLSRSTVSFREALLVFQLMAGQTDIAFGFPGDGCYARAHLMVRWMQKLG